jgi:hypothetical protein
VSTQTLQPSRKSSDQVLPETCGHAAHLTSHALQVWAAHIPGTLAKPKLPRRIRTALLTVHIVFASAWVGILTVSIYIALSESLTTRQLVQLNNNVTYILLIPVVSTTLLTGFILTLGTPWGITKHWWIAVKCTISLGIAAAGATLTILNIQSVEAKSIGLVLLVIVIGISVAKPWGKTARGRAPERRSTRHRSPKPQTHPLPGKEARGQGAAHAK